MPYREISGATINNVWRKKIEEMQEEGKEQEWGGGGGVGLLGLDKFYLYVPSRSTYREEKRISNQLISKVY